MRDNIYVQIPTPAGWLMIGITLSHPATEKRTGRIDHVKHKCKFRK